MALLSLALGLALTFAGMARVAPAADGDQAIGGGSPCESLSAQAASELGRKLARFKAEGRVDEAESLATELGSAFDSHPCDLAFGAVAEGFSDGQIASLISAMPLEFVDTPCKSNEKLMARIELLMAVPGLYRASSIAGHLQGAMERDARECLRQQRE